ncbi:PREDICTED: uncharacterized protein LOC105449099 [Wasmannia auropunctata]|uniref:uncharacterized protein LOC105449099 n=1 Tax=Wasmannia auropunctata TaxID=64793 RepID=UPI0005F0AB03|nr:PREDICTED: uncharacterized protein LOC105449099 [Wasmannia auropunctata]
MVQHRFTSMKQTFVTNFRKERESQKRCSGKSSEDIYKPKWALYGRLKFLKKSCVQAESTSNLQTPINTSYSDNTESVIGIDTDNIIEENNSENIEYLEKDFIDLTQYNLHNTQHDLDSPEIFSLDEISACSSTKNLSNSFYNSQLDSGSSGLSSSSTAKLSATIHSPANLKSTSDKKNIYIKRGSVKKRKGSLVEEAIGAIKTLSNQCTSENDSVEYFGNFVAARLREMSSLTRKRCEHDIMKCLADY